MMTNPASPSTAPARRGAEGSLRAPRSELSRDGRARRL